MALPQIPDRTDRKRRTWRWFVLAASVLSAGVVHAGLQSPTLEAQLLTAAQNGDVALAGDLLGKGAAVNARNEFELTPLIVAADKGNAALVRLLVSRGAEINAKDLTYGKTALRAAISSWGDLRGDQAPKATQERSDIIDLLLAKGARGDEALAEMIAAGYVGPAHTVIDRGAIERPYLNLALASAKRARQPELVDLLSKLGGSDPAPQDNARSVERFKLLAGTYRNSAGGELTLTLLDEDLMLDRPGRDRVFLLPLDLTALRSRDRRVAVLLETPVVPPAQVTLRDNGTFEVFRRVGDR